MRIWDVSAGYLNRASLLGEHRELHGLLSILRDGKRGYARHPETLRWVGCVSGLVRRHEQLAAEMRLRGYVDRSPAGDPAIEPVWPATFVTSPGGQLERLREKYVGKEGGRIPLPRNAVELWAQHKYSVLARDPQAYGALGRKVAAAPGPEGMEALALELVEALRREPPAPRLANAVDHMWGYVADAASADEKVEALRGAGDRLAVVQRLALRNDVRYLIESTALSELAPYI